MIDMNTDWNSFPLVSPIIATATLGGERFQAPASDAFGMTGDASNNDKPEPKFSQQQIDDSNKLNQDMIDGWKYGSDGYTGYWRQVDNGASRGVTGSWDVFPIVDQLPEASAALALQSLSNMMD